MRKNDVWRSKLRKEAVTAEAWATTWQDIDLRMAETQKKLLRFAHALRRDGRLQEAIECYQRLTEVHPRFADGWYELGLARQDLGVQTAGSIRAFERGLRLSPAAEGRLCAYGVLLQAAGRMPEATHAYQTAIKRRPDEHEAHFNLGTVREADGDLDAALLSYRRALALDPPDEARIQNNIGGVLSALGRWEQSAAAYAEAVESDPGFADGWYNLANVHLAQGRHSKAESHLLTALRISPAHPRAARKLNQVRADAIVPLQARFEAEYQLQMVDAAAKACGDAEDAIDQGTGDGGGSKDEMAGQNSRRRQARRVSCIESHLNSSRTAREADGPWFI